MSDQRAALLQTKELQELQELPLQSQRRCQNKIFCSQKIKPLKPKQKRERGPRNWTTNGLEYTHGRGLKLLQREEGGKGELIVRKHELEEGS
jgi:hypothetical protein